MIATEIPKRLENLPFTPAIKRAPVRIAKHYRSFTPWTIWKLRERRRLVAKRRSTRCVKKICGSSASRFKLFSTTMDEVFQSIGSTIKAAKGKTLTTERINELFEKFRSIPAKLKW